MSLKRSVRKVWNLTFAQGHVIRKLEPTAKLDLTILVGIEEDESIMDDFWCATHFGGVLDLTE